MSLETYGYSAQNKRIKLISKSELLAFVMLVFIVCWLIFPRDLSLTLRDSELDAVSKQYIEIWLQAKPDDVQLRILLAQGLIHLGQLEQASQHLKIIQKSHKKSIAAQGYWLHAQLEFERLMAIQPADRREHLLWAISKQALSYVDYRILEPKEIAQYIRMSLLLGFTKDAFSAASYWLQTNNPDSQEITVIADSFAAYQSHSAAASLYIQALIKTQNPEQKSVYFLFALASYQAGSLFGGGTELIQRFARLFLDDEKILYRIVQFARAADNHALASFYASHLMGLEVKP